MARVTHDYWTGHCCYARGDQDGPSANLSTPTVLESCLSEHHSFPHIAHNSGKRVFVNVDSAPSLVRKINVLNGTLICSYLHNGQSNFSRILTTPLYTLVQPTVGPSAPLVQLVATKLSSSCVIVVQQHESGTQAKHNENSRYQASS